MGVTHGMEFDILSCVQGVFNIMPAIDQLVIMIYIKNVNEWTD